MVLPSFLYAGKRLLACINSRYFFTGIPIQLGYDFWALIPLSAIALQHQPAFAKRTACMAWCPAAYLPCQNAWLPATGAAAAIRGAAEALAEAQGLPMVLQGDGISIPSLAKILKQFFSQV